MRQHGAGLAKPATDGNSKPMSALLASEVERSVQEHCTRFMEPHVEVFNATAMQLQGLWDLSKGNSKKLIQMDHAFRDMQEGLLKIEDFRSELDRYETNLNKQASDTESLVERFEVQLAQVRLFTSQKEEAYLQHRSALDSLRHDLTHLQQLHESSKETLFKSIEKSLGQVAPVKAELEAQLANMQLQHHHLTDQVWGSETAIARISGEVKNVHQRYDALAEVVKSLTDEKDSREKLEAMQQELADWLSQSRFEAASIRKAFSAATAANKESIRIGLDVAGNQIANFMDEIRQENQKILTDTEQLRKETESICASFRAEMGEMNIHRKYSDERNEAIQKELREALNEYDRRRKREKTTLELEMKEVGQQLSILHDSVEDAVLACKSVEPLCSCLVEALAMQVCLERQEFADWTRVSLVGYKPVSSNKSMEAEQDSLRTTPRSQTGGFPSPKPPKLHKESPRKKDETSQVISLDKRCYSCCSQTQMVMSGFKMACLNYRPSVVHFKKGSFERLELFDKMDELLAKARAQMRFTRDSEDVDANPLRNTSKGDVRPVPVVVEVDTNVKTQAKPTFVLPALSAR